MMASSGKKQSESGRFPPNPTQWDAERNGLKLRADFDRPPEEPLKPFTLSLPNVFVLATRRELDGLVDQDLLILLFGAHRDKWSGMTIPRDDHFIVVLNETHARTRQHATLMEELFHILLNHKPSRVGTCPVTGVIRREYDPAIEKEAYHSAAAALVPYCALKAMVNRGATATDVADHFEVSISLVNFRLKTCKLFKRASENR
jgi:Zn-dependent peptidase ImmA (M78 family)